jgi:hypothetical protein
MFAPTETEIAARLGGDDDDAPVPPTGKDSAVIGFT